MNEGDTPEKWEIVTDIGTCPIKESGGVNQSWVSLNLYTYIYIYMYKEWTVGCSYLTMQFFVEVFHSKDSGQVGCEPIRELQGERWTEFLPGHQILEVSHLVVEFLLKFLVPDKHQKIVG